MMNERFWRRAISIENKNRNVGSYDKNQTTLWYVPPKGPPDAPDPPDDHRTIGPPDTPGPLGPPDTDNTTEKAKNTRRKQVRTQRTPGSAQRKQHRTQKNQGEHKESKREQKKQGREHTCATQLRVLARSRSRRWRTSSAFWTSRAAGSRRASVSHHRSTRAH